DEVVGGGNRIAPGDLVDVFFLLEKGVEIQAGQARLLQSRVRVLAYGTASVDGPEDKGTLPGPPGQPARTAVLAVPVEQVSELLLAGRSGRLQLALRPVGDDGGPDTQLFAQRAAVLSPRPDLTPEQRALLQSGPNRAYAGESLAQLEGTSPAARPAAVRATGGGGGRSVEILRGDKSERVRY
ncbi:MAG: Flp pilus assembly protein CpaB, partial [Achromobacter xylosoxidans]|nr:Flp pilus assembly protein CpaB [Achromobacter xylosoxidans]